jgi:hypothetical protein
MKLPCVDSQNAAVPDWLAILGEWLAEYLHPLQEYLNDNGSHL